MPSGCYSRLTAEEIAQVRAAYDRLEAARAERRALVARLRISRDHWCLVGKGLRGKKPRPHGVR